MGTLIRSTGHITIITHQDHTKKILQTKSQNSNFCDNSASKPKVGIDSVNRWFNRWCRSVSKGKQTLRTHCYHQVVLASASWGISASALYNRETRKVSLQKDTFLELISKILIPTLCLTSVFNIMGLNEVIVLSVLWQTFSCLKLICSYLDKVMPDFPTFY